MMRLQPSPAALRSRALGADSDSDSMVNVVSDLDSNSAASILPASTATDDATTSSTAQVTDIEGHKNLPASPVTVSQMRLLDYVTKEQQAASKALINWTGERHGDERCEVCP